MILGLTTQINQISVTVLRIRGYVVQGEFQKVYTLQAINVLLRIIYQSFCGIIINDYTETAG